MFVRMSNPPRRRCAFCQEWSVALCDGPSITRKSGTCDKPMCEKHRKPVGPNQDMCPKCVAAGSTPEQGVLSGIL